MASFITDLDTPLLSRSAYPDDNFTVRDANSGVHIFGGIGSGKTSGSGKMLSGAYLRAGMGGCITAVKPEEITLWKKYCAQHGRSRSLVLFDETEGFNFLTYELGRQNMEGIGTVVECLMRILDAAKRCGISPAQSGGEAFWQDSARMLLRYALLPLYAAYGAVTIPDIIRFVSSAPQTSEDVKSKDWQDGSFMYETMNAAANRPKVPIERDVMVKTVEYWSKRFLAVPDKTRGNMVVTIDSVLDRFLHGRLKRAFCGETTIVPELSFHGALILLAMPTLTWNEDGIIAQQLFKFMWQRAVLGRNSLAEKHRERPVFLWSDEAQETVNSYDGEFLSMCRGSKCSVVYLTQSLPTYYAKLGGEQGKQEAHSLVGKFMSHIYHSNACPDTNEFASRVIGKVVKRRSNFSSGNSQSVNFGMSSGNNESGGESSNSGNSFGKNGGGYNLGSGSSKGYGNNWGANKGRAATENINQGYSETMEAAIEPGDFARILKNGGKQNGNLVTGLWFQSGRVFKSTGSNVLMGTFRQ